MGLFVSTQEIDVHLGEPKSQKGRGKKDKGKRFQILPIKIFIPSEHPRGSLAEPITNAVDDALNYLEGAKVQGALTKIHQGPYILSIYLTGKSAEERNKSLSGKPALVLKGVTLGAVTIIAEENHYTIQTKLKVPWKNVEQAGELSGLCDTGVVVYFVAEQIELELGEKEEEKAEKPAKRSGSRGMIKD